jgi:hypothetical protein
MADTSLRLTGTRTDIDAFLRDPSVNLRPDEATVSAPEQVRDDDRLGHVEIVEVIIRISESAAARAVYDGIRAGFEAFSRRKRMNLEDVIEDDAAAR